MPESHTIGKLDTSHRRRVPGRAPTLATVGNGRGPTHHLRSARRLWWYGLVFVGVVALLGVVANRELGFLQADSTKPALAGAPAPSAKHGEATTTTSFLTLRSRGFGRGDCVTYDQTPGREAQTMKVVSC